MRAQTFTIAFASAVLLVAVPSLADHNSKNGEGTANMPNDIHNTRVETLETNDNETFQDFVRYGEGSTSVNRFESEETQPSQANARQGEANAAIRKGESPAQNQNRTETNTGRQDRARVESRTRLEPGAADRPRRDSSARSTRSRDKGSRGRKK
jgi:hypothetical protein